MEIIALGILDILYIINLTILECKFGLCAACSPVKLDNKSNHIGM